MTIYSVIWFHERDGCGIKGSYGTRERARIEKEKIEEEHRESGKDLMYVPDYYVVENQLYQDEAG